MAKYKQSSIPDDVYQYICKTGNRISKEKDELFQETLEKFPKNITHTTERTQAELLKLLVKLSNGKRGIEVGLFTGYSSICMAEGLPEDGQLICLDINKDWSDLAVKYWKKCGVDQKCELRLGQATDTLNELLKEEKNVGGFDFAYVDADKSNYINYHELLLKLLRPNGFIAYDNTLWNYKVARPSEPDDLDTNALKHLNESLQKDERVDICQLHIGDGITLVRKR